MGPKTFYVTSRVPPSRLRFFHRAIATYLQTYYGPNDGMVAVRDQSLPGLGTCLGVLDAGHTDLTHRFPATRAPRRYRRALVQAILMAVAATTDSGNDGSARSVPPGEDRPPAPGQRREVRPALRSSPRFFRPR